MGAPIDEEKQDINALDRAIGMLKVHYDTVQIFCTRHDNEKNETTNVNKGSGNWFARFGHVRSWLKAEENSFGQKIIEESDE